MDLGGAKVYEHEPLAVTAKRVRDQVVAKKAFGIDRRYHKTRYKLAVERAKPSQGPTPREYTSLRGEEGRFLETFDLAGSR